MDWSRATNIKSIAGYLGIIGLVVGVFVQFGYIPVAFDQILSSALLFFTFYAIDVVHVALGPTDSVGGRVITSGASVIVLLILEHTSGSEAAIAGATTLVGIFLTLTWVVTRGTNWTEPPWKLKRRYDVAYRGAAKLDPTFASKDVLFLWGRYRTADIELLRFGTVAVVLLPYFGGLLAAVFLLAIVDFLIPSSFVLSVGLLVLALLGFRRTSPKRGVPSGLPREIVSYAVTAWDRSEDMDLARSSILVRLFRSPKAFLYLALLVFVATYCFELLFLPSLLLLSAPNFVADFLEPTASAYSVLSTVGAIPNAVIPLYITVSTLLRLTGGKQPWQHRHPVLSLAASAFSGFMIFGPFENLRLVGLALPGWMFGPFVWRSYLVGVLGGLQIVNLVWSYERRDAAGQSDFVGWKVEASLVGYVVILILVTGGSLTVSFLSFLMVGSLFWYSASRFFISAQKWPGRMWERARKELVTFALAFVAVVAYGLVEDQPPVLWLGLLGLALTGFMALGDVRMRKLGWVIFGVKEVEGRGKPESHDFGPADNS